MGERTCSIGGCDTRVKARGWCRRHYLQWHRTGDPVAPERPTVCAVDECAAPPHCRGWCEPHYKRWYYAGDPVKTATQVSCELCTGAFVRPPDGRTKRCSACRAGVGRSSAVDRQRTYRERTYQDPAIRRQAKSAPCLVCAGEVEQLATYGALRQLCSDDCRSVHFVHWRQQYSERIRDRSQARQHQRRAWKWAVAWESFRPREIFERDGWVCSICTREIDPTLRYPHRLSASLDHVIPLSKQGAHTRANTAAAHLTCNIQKGDRLPAVL